MFNRAKLLRADFHPYKLEGLEEPLKARVCYEYIAIQYFERFYQSHD